MSELSNPVESARDFRRLTIRQRKFIKHFVRDPKSATAAAIAAGYSPTSARTLGSRLLRDPVIQSALSEHFAMQESFVSEILTQALQAIKSSLAEGADSKTKQKAIKNLLDYVKIANNVLGLNLKDRIKDLEPEEDLTLDELVALHRSELARLTRLQEKALDHIEPTIPESTIREGEVLQ